MESKTLTHKLFHHIGIEQKDIPKAFIAFKTLNYVSYLTTFVLCYRYRPAKIFLRSTIGQSVVGTIKNKFPRYVTYVENGATELTDRMKDNKYFQMIPTTLGLKTSRFSKAFVENFFIYKLSFPLMLPLYLYGSVKYVQFSKSQTKKIE